MEPRSELMPSNFEQPLKVPKSVINYLHDKHETIVNDYKNSDGEVENCALIALDIADLLVADGQEPYVVRLVGNDVIENGFTHAKNLTPRIYEGRVSWEAHLVCVCDGLIFDPMLGQPVSLEEYSRKVFGEDIKTKILLSPKMTRELSIDLDLRRDFERTCME
jgi:hypothetical protein